jgi:hypothetical protein
MLLLGHGVNFPGKNQRMIVIDCNPVVLKKSSGMCSEVYLSNRPNATVN